MRYLIISDIHGNRKGLNEVLEKEKDIDKVIFLGDGLSDIIQIKKEFPRLQFDVVRGNCDVSNSIAPMQIINIGGYTVLLCHGDGFDVKMSLLALRRTAISLNATIALYGHTHKQYYEYLDGLYIFCPGSVSPDICAGFKVCYGIMDLNNPKPLFYHKAIE
ncbi:MAG: YfcE family phosphodiesterase [Oscillospiraceae bacterium]